MDGVKSVDVNMVSQTTTIVFDDTKTNFEKVREALQRENQAVLGGPTYK